jgi:hypothetical protein
MQLFLCYTISYPIEQMIYEASDSAEFLLPTHVCIHCSDDRINPKNIASLHSCLSRLLWWHFTPQQPGSSTQPD